jgi:hypothetical protein
MWALLPAGALLLVYGDSGPLAMLIGTAVLALVLRSTVSLPLTVLTSVAVGAASGLALIVFAGQFLDQIVVFFAQFLANLEQQLAANSNDAVVLARPTATQVAGILGTANAVTSVLCLLLARWWQAALFNPGGFGEEFRDLFLPPAATALLLIVALALAAMGVQYRAWSMICLVPLSFAGLALIHARAAWRGQGRGLLTGFYVVWLIIDPVKLLVVLAAIADSWFNFRQRWVHQSDTDTSSSEDDDRG